MSPSLAWSNLVAYSLEVGLLVALAAPMPAVLRLRAARARLAYWQILLAVCLALPLVRPWRQAVVSGDMLITTRILATSAPAAPTRPLPSAAEIALVLMAAGVVVRLFWLAVGMWRLRRYRCRSRPLEGAVDARVRVAEGIAGPVTFGFLRPVVLVPPRFAALDAEAREAVLCHELLHVTRGDWLFTVAEELIRAVLWFHPAIWWLLGEVQLAREQAVDGEVVRRTRLRDGYVDALLAMAGAAAEPDLLPAPRFLRKRHLKKRVVAIFEEVRMSKTRLITALAAGLCVMAAAGWLATATFPLAAAPQVVNDAPGVTVDVGGATLLHRTGVAYPETARTAGVQGTVTMEVKLDAHGNVSDARVLSGPDELRKSTLQSVLQWHFGHEAAGATRQVTVAFQLPAQATAPSSVPAESKPRTTPGSSSGTAARPWIEGRTIRTLTISGLSPALRDELAAKLQIQVGDTVTPELMERAHRVMREFDEHLTVYAVPAGTNEAVIQILAPGAAAGAAEGPTPPNLIRVGGNVQQTKLIQQVRPVYPPDAKAQGIQGRVRMNATIAKDGTVEKLELVEGEPILAQAAMNAVRQWVYQPTLLNGEPVEVQTVIDVNFTLSK